MTRGTTMTDISERMTRVEEAQHGLNTYLPLLLKRFEGIEDRLEADLKATEQKLDDIREEARDGNRNIIISVLATAVTLVVTGILF